MTVSYAWHRRYELVNGTSLLVYSPRHPEYQEWEILRVPPSADLAGYLPWCYEVRKDDRPYSRVGLFHYLHKAKDFVMREGRRGMSGGHFPFGHVHLRNDLADIAEDPEVLSRWPAVARMFASLAASLSEVMHEMDCDLSSDARVNDPAWETEAVHRVHEGARRALEH